MLKRKTHFKQVRLAIVLKIVNEQIRRDGLAGPSDLFKGETCEKELVKKAS